MAVVENNRLLRQVFWLKALVGILLLSNFLLGTLAVWSIRTSDLAYASLLEKNLPLIEKLNDVTVDFSRVQRRHLNLFLVPASEISAVRSDCDQLLQVADNSLQNATVLLADANLASEANELAHLADIYRGNLVKMDGYFTSNQRESAAEFARSNLRPSLENILRQADQLLSRIQGDALRESRRLAEGSRVKNALFLGLAGWPLFFIIGAVVLFFAVVMILAFLASRLRLDERD